MGRSGRCVLAGLALALAAAGCGLQPAAPDAPAAATAAAQATTQVAAQFATPAAARTNAPRVAKGRLLAAVGDCAACHSTPDGPAYAGGVAFDTPFGRLYSTNITPDPGQGIGRWTAADFARAMREGLRPDGRPLYPVFPYAHFSRLDDADLQALYAFLMSRDPAAVPIPPNALAFPAAPRGMLVFWRLLFSRPTDFRPDPGHGAEWNRGAYLVEGLGHCGACHAPRNSLGAERAGSDLVGGEVEGWQAPRLDAGNAAPQPWSVAALDRYLREGADPGHGAAAGPMAPVVRALAGADPQDVQAMAVYLADRMRPAGIAQTPAAPRRVAAAAPASDVRAGAALFEGACAACHAPGTGTDLEASTTVNADTPTNAIRVIMEGIEPAAGEPGRAMPGFAAALTPAQADELLAYLRARYSARSPWPPALAEIAAVRAGLLGGAMAKGPAP
jgi:mono/diheme cytochrome c family protein